MIVERLWKFALSILLAFTGGLILWSGLLSRPAQVTANGAIDWPDIELVEIETGFDFPVHITHAGDGSDRIFVVEQDGVIRIIKNGTLLGTPFLNISGRVQFNGTSNDEQGLLSVAFPPDYANKNYFYVYYTNNSGDNVVTRFFVDDPVNTPDVADPNSEQPVLYLNHPSNSNHNGGQLAFGPNDGYLYLAPGDGGSSNDPPNNAQTTSTLLGKVLRLDVETGAPTATYTIPASNPFTQTAALDEIWALGLRNPWRFSFDRQTGDLYIGDVGQGAREEIDFQPAASVGTENYGWKILEGTICRPPTSGCTPPANYVPPIADYPRSSPDCSVTGGYVYRGQLYYRMQGVYFYSDFCSGRIRALKYDGSAWQGLLLLDTPYSVSTFGEDEAGNLYLAHRAGGPNGTIYQIVDTGEADLSPSTKTVSPIGGDPGQTFTFTITLINSGGQSMTQTTFVTDTLPTGLAYVPNTLAAPFGTYDDTGGLLTWEGLLNPTSTVQITFQVTATGEMTGTLQNIAEIEGQNAGRYTRSATVFIPGNPIYLPVIFK
ncbi:MAG TPA: PQQ-dependent sugar dehydrogenase [Anaerolineae bacterium]|jgi:uncharacterized repeat protein (TIGR01451 family)